MTNSRPLRFAVSTALAVGVVACDSGDKNVKDTDEKGVKQDKDPEPELRINEGPQEEPEADPKVGDPKIADPKIEDPEIEVPIDINTNEGPMPEPKMPEPKIPTANPGPEPEPEPEPEPVPAKPR